MALVAQTTKTKAALAPCSAFQNQLSSGKTERRKSQPETQLGNEPATQGQ